MIHIQSGIRLPGRPRGMPLRAHIVDERDMAPFGITWGSGKGRPSKQRLDQIRSDQAARRLADQERAAARSEGRQPIINQPGHASMMQIPPAGSRMAARREAPDPPGAQAETAAQGGFMAFIRDCCPNPLDRLFGGNARQDLEAANDPRAYAPISGGERGRGHGGEQIPLMERVDAGTERMTYPATHEGSGPKRSATLPSTAPDRESQFGIGVGTGRERTEPKLRKRRHSEEPNHAGHAAPIAEEGGATGAARKASLPKPDGWKLNDARPKREKELQPVAQRKADEFRNYLRLGYKPSDAATMLGPGTWLKPLKATDNQYEIRLNQHDRLTFRSNPDTKEVTILEIGGHT